MVFFKSENKGLRNLKMQGSSKIDAYCTAGFQLLHLDSNKLQLIYNKTHYGHTCSLGYLPIAKELRQQIAVDLVQGVSFDKIMDKIRDNVCCSIERSHLVTKKDLYNIEQSFNLRKMEKHKDDAMSVHLWVQEVTCHGKHNPVLFYKPQGQILAELGTNQGLGVHDFALVLQTPLQSEMFKSCGNNRVICVDATHGTNSYDFVLITVLVIDELGEGFPVAWCYSNKEDSTLLTNFFQHLKEHVGSVQPLWFMSDDADQYYKCWSQVYKNKPQKLLCTWHVDRAWRKAISRITDQELQISVYHTLRVLLEEQDNEKFQRLLEGASKQWQENPKLEKFYKYFSQEYLNRYSQWSKSYRKKAAINTNMFVESFHRVLKYVYQKGKVNKRMDKTIHLLLKYARDKLFDRLVKIEKGKNTTRIQAISQRHKSSLALSTDLVSIDSNENNVWNVKSGKGEEVYQVKLEQAGCKYNCFMRCRTCSICIHQYSCTCMDSLLQVTICKHIHLTMRLLNKSSDEDVTKTLSMKACDYKSGQSQMLSLVGNIPVIESNMKKEKMISKISQISKYIMQSSNKECLQLLDKHLTTCIGLIKIFKPTTNEPANKNIEQQRHFYSTKRKRQKKNLRLSKPPESKAKEILQSLLHASIPKEAVTLPTDTLGK